MKRGFTLIEILMVLGIVSLMASVMYANFNAIRTRERDRKRLNDIRLVELALESYWNKHGNYPVSDRRGCGNWDTPGDGTFLKPLVDENMLPGHVLDPLVNDDCGNFRYNKFTAGANSCDGTKGDYYVLGIVDLETVPDETFDDNSPGFACGNVDFQTQFEWVTGKFRY